MDGELYKKELLNRNNSYDKISDYLMPFLPKRLYKYGSFSSEYWEDLIIKGKVYLSKASDFNDPFDCLVHINFEELLKSQKIRRLVTERFSYLNDSDLDKVSQYEISQEIIHSFQEDIRAACFSEEWNSVLMWSHYSECHKGFCIEYDTENMSRFKRYMFFAVLYQENQIDVTNDLINIYPNAGLISMVSKAQEWSYEKEWRMISFEENSDAYRYLKKDMKSIILGSKCENRYKDQICEWASKNSREVYQIKISSTKYELNKERIV